MTNRNIASGRSNSNSYLERESCVSDDIVVATTVKNWGKFLSVREILTVTRAHLLNDFNAIFNTAIIVAVLKSKIQPSIFKSTVGDPI